MNLGKKKTDIKNPHAGANIFSKITYAWTIPLFKTGFNRDLNSSDIYDALDEHSSGRLGDAFSQLWNEQLKAGTPSLPKVIFLHYKWQILLYALLTLILDCGIRICQPILLGKFISYFSESHIRTTKAQMNLFAFGLVMTAWINVVIAQSVAMALMHLGLKIKVGCCSLIYRKSLKLSKTSSGQTTVGQVVNLLSNDVNRLQTVTSMSNYLFVGPMQTLIVTILIWREIGVASVVGVFVLLSVVPLQLWLGTKISSFRSKSANMTDERMQRMSEILNGIKVIKMYAWEKSFHKLIQIVRKKEMKWIAGTSYIRGIIVSFSLFHPRFSLFCSIMCYVALGNQITAQKMFVVTSFYSLLSQSMTVFFPRAISYFADFFVSAKRINRFLLYEDTVKPITASIGRPRDTYTKKSELSKLFINEPEGNETMIPFYTGDNVKEIILKFNNPSDSALNAGDINGLVKEEWNKSTNYLDIVLENAITIEQAFVKWIPTNSEYNLSNITLNIKTGSFVAIVGPVGGGKSSLLNTILKELPLHRGALEVYGEISYASQDPWLFNATIKENILFGSKMEKVRFNKVVQKCALDRDFNSLPYGEKTFVGEDGCNLSGGQRARVNLARAVYRRADIYLLDDPLSAVDAHVGRQLFDDCMLDYLNGKTRLLVTHQLQYLKEVDKIIILNNGFMVAEGTYAELEKSNPDFQKLLSSHHVHNQHDEIEEIEKKYQNRDRLSSVNSDDSDDDHHVEDKQDDEFQTSGSVGGYVYCGYLTATKSMFLVSLVLLAAMSAQALASSADYWTSHWVNSEEISNRHNQNMIEDISLVNSISIVNITSIMPYTSEYLTDYNVSSTPTSIEKITKTLTTSFVERIMPTSFDNVFDGGFENLTSLADVSNTTELIKDILLETTNLFGNGLQNSSLRYLNKNTTTEDCLQSVPRSYYIIIYTIMIILLIIVTLSRSSMFFWSAMRASVTLHSDMFDSICHGTMQFFNKNPSGRILNRFSKDLHSVDEVLPANIIDVLQIAMQILGTYLISVIINYWLLVPILLTIGVFIILRIYYISTSRSIYRLVGTTRSPTLSHLSASLRGITTIRAFGNQRSLEKEFDCLQNVHTSVEFMNIATSRAFGFWLDTVCIFFIAIVVFSFVFSSNSILGGSVGLVICQAMNLMSILQYGIRMSAQMENEMISVERILDYTDIEHEPPSTVPEDEHLPVNWPSDGRVEFHNVSLRYSATKPPAIRDLSFVIRKHEKVGIVGRTGAGKSSIINALFRLEFIQGFIEIDECRTDTLGLLALRSKLAIIPQEPVLFSGTVRDNLDPFNEYTDEILWNSLEQVQLKIVIKELAGGLSAVMSEGGINFSVGQRQLFCLARAITRNNHILILDEATANVDQKTDSLIQQTIRTQFADCTVITIAHRLQTVMDSDKVLVMDTGKMVEYDHPYILLCRDGGIFKKMAQEYGNVRMEAFLNVAKKSYDELLKKV